MQTVRASGPDVIVGLDARFTRHRGPVTCVTCVPGSDAAVTSGYDGAVAWVDLAAGRLELLGYHDHLVNRISVNAAGTKAASSSSDYSVYLGTLQPVVSSACYSVTAMTSRISSSSTTTRGFPCRAIRVCSSGIWIPAPLPG